LQSGADSSLTMTSQIVKELGVEPKLIGAAFNKEYQSKISPAIEGASAVYYIKVNSIQAKPADTPDVIATQEESRRAALRAQLNTWYDGLKKPADIKDNRSKFY
jgi:peptidyl-prolyl cis-trans isomerase D